MIKEMYERGMSISDIARELGIDRKTVRKYIHSPNPPSKSMDLSQYFGHQ
jgi:predicted transcriptional regulator